MKKNIEFILYEIDTFIRISVYLVSEFSVLCCFESINLNFLEFISFKVYCIE